MMRGNYPEVARMEALTVAKTAAPMGAMMAGGGGEGGRGTVTKDRQRMVRGRRLVKEVEVESRRMRECRQQEQDLLVE